MNLSNRQLWILAEEILKEVMPIQKKNLESLWEDTKKKIKQDLLKKYPEFKTIFKIVDWVNIVNMSFSSKFMSEIVWDKMWGCNIESIESLVNYVYNHTIKKIYVDKYWEEITKETIERMLILETIWATTIEELVSWVKKRLNIN